MNKCFRSIFNGGSGDDTIGVPLECEDGESMGKPAPGTTALQQVEFYQVGKLGRHILLCAGDNCCTAAEGDAAWGYLKRRVAELGLDREPESVFRTKCHCLRICVGGPILVVYPEGVWYGGATEAGIERILQEHVLGRKVVEELVIGRGELKD